MKNAKMEKPIQRAIRTKNVKFLCKLYFGYDLEGEQNRIVRKVAFNQKGNLSVCAMTRYGKSLCVALGIGLYILLNQNKKIAFIAPTREQAGILRDYMAELISMCPELSQISDLEYLDEKTSNKADKLKKEASKNRLTFTNGCEYRIFTAHNDGKALMGFGVGSSGGKIVKDEATLLSDEAQTRIARMKGDNPELTQEIELFNPWDRENKAFEHYNSPNWEKIHIDYRQAIEDKRITDDFIEEQRKELTPLEFQVLYESIFPDQPEDSIFSLSEIKKSIDSDIDLETEYNKLKEKLKESHKMSEKESNDLRKEFKGFNKVISCDVADKGLDETVIFWGYRKEHFYQIVDYYSEPKSENMNIAGRIKNTIKEFGEGEFVEVNIDSIGIGQGVVSRLKELKDEENLNIKITECHSGEKAIDSNRYLNKKAENYFRLKSLMEDNQIKILDAGKLKNQLANIKWEMNSSGKIKIIDPEEKSPDYSDCASLFVWKGEKFEFGFMEF